MLVIPGPVIVKPAGLFSAIDHHKVDAAIGASFLPSDLSGLTLWTRPESLSGLSDNDPINVWSDESGAANHLDKLADATRPIYKTGILNGLASVRHTIVTENILVRALAYEDANWTISYVAKYTNTTTPGRILGASNNWLLGFYTSTLDNAYWGDWVLGPGGGPAHDTTARIYTGTRLEATSANNFYVNDTLLASNTLATVGPATLTTNGFNAGTTEKSNSDVFEIVIYDRVLTGAERGQVVTYLNQKYLVF